MTALFEVVPSYNRVVQFVVFKPRNQLAILHICFPRLKDYEVIELVIQIINCPKN